MVATEKPDKVAINVRNVPRSLRSRFKSWCAEQDTTMENAIIELIRQACKKTK